MLLQKLSLENFQGIKELTLEFPHGCSASIYGDNATGKTTVFNAVTWILFDKASTGAKNYTPQTKGPDGDVHNLEHKVTAEFILDGGRVVELSKVYKEIWKKKRGAANKELTGHGTSYFINGVPAKEAEYNTTVAAYMGGDAERPKILTIPDYFPERMKWDERRRILLEVCGDVADEDVITQNKELTELKSFLRMPGQPEQMYTLDEYRQITKAQRVKINRELDTIPQRIDEAEKAVPAIARADRPALEEEEKRLGDEIIQIEQQIADAGTETGRSLFYKSQIADAKADLKRSEIAYENERIKAQSGIRKAIEDDEWKINHIKGQIQDADRNLTDVQYKIRQMEKHRDSLMDAYRKLADIHWDAKRETCPTCGRILPADQIVKMRSDFNVSKSKKLEEISNEGKAECSASMISELEEQADKIKADKAGYTASLERFGEEKERLEAKARKHQMPPYSKTGEYSAKTAQIRRLEEEAKNATVKPDVGLQKELDAKRQQRREVLDKLAAAGVKDAQEKRIEKLHNRERELAEKYEETEHGLYLADLFVKTKVSMLTDRINSHFKTVSFQLFENQANGGIKECCEVLVPGEGGRMVPYPYANNAARINAGLEIIGTLSKHWNLHLPVIIDNCEAVTHPIKIGTQEIKLYVSEHDKTLRLETENDSEQNLPDNRLQPV